VTGVLGKSAAGLELLKRGCMRGRTKDQRQALDAHRMPQPRCNVGSWLAQRNLASSMMDLSDGLSVDLPRLCAASGVGAEIDSQQIPVFSGSGGWNCDPFELALHGGEDFELLFTVPKRKLEALERSFPKSFPRLTRIGKLTSDARAVTVRSPGKGIKPLPQRGFDHFRD
jgi:thiamine-monophosphate kinase